MDNEQEYVYTKVKMYLVLAQLCQDTAAIINCDQCSSIEDKIRVAEEVIDNSPLSSFAIDLVVDSQVGLGFVYRRGEYVAHMGLHFAAQDDWKATSFYSASAQCTIWIDWLDVVPNPTGLSDTLCTGVSSQWVLSDEAVSDRCILHHIVCVDQWTFENIWQSVPLPMHETANSELSTFDECPLLMSS